MTVFLRSALLVAGFTFSTITHANLFARDLDGDNNTVEAYFDDELNISWLSDANAAQTTGFDSDGDMSWDMAQQWAHNLNVAGITGWRLPTMTDLGAPGCDMTYSGSDCGYNVDTQHSELAHLSYRTLANPAEFDTNGYFQGGYGYTHTGSLEGLSYQGDLFWLGLNNSAAPSEAWFFSTGSGRQATLDKTNEFHAWAVFDGDVANATPILSPIPESSTYALMLSGLLIVLGLAKRTKN